MPHCSSEHEEEQFESMVGGAASMEKKRRAPGDDYNNQAKRPRNPRHGISPSNARAAAEGNSLRDHGKSLSVGANPHHFGRSRKELNKSVVELIKAFGEELDKETKNQMAKELLRRYFEVKNKNKTDPFAPASQPSHDDVEEMLSDEDAQKLLNFFKSQKILHNGSGGMILLAPSNEIKNSHYDLVHRPGGFIVVDTDDFFQLGTDAFGTNSPTFIQATSSSIIQAEYNRKLSIPKSSKYVPLISQLVCVFNFLYNNSDYIEKNTSHQFRQLAYRCINWACWYNNPTIMAKANAYEIMESRSAELEKQIEGILYTVNPKIPVEDLQKLLIEIAKAVRDSIPHDTDTIIQKVNEKCDELSQKMAYVEQGTLELIKNSIIGSIRTNGGEAPQEGGGYLRKKTRKHSKKKKPKMSKRKSKKHLKKSKKHLKKSKKGKKTGKKVRFHSSSKKSKKNTRKRR